MMRPVEDELVLSLITAVIRHYRGAIWPIGVLVTCAAEMALRLNIEQRIQLAESMRDAADIVEREPQRVTQ